MASDPLPPHLHEYLDGLVPPRPPEMQAMEGRIEETLRRRRCWNPSPIRRLGCTTGYTSLPESGTSTFAWS